MIPSCRVSEDEKKRQVTEKLRREEASQRRKAHRFRFHTNRFITFMEQLAIKWRNFRRNLNFDRKLKMRSEVACIPKAWNAHVRSLNGLWSAWIGKNDERYYSLHCFIDNFTSLQTLESWWRSVAITLKMSRNLVGLKWNGLCLKSNLAFGVEFKKSENNSAKLMRIRRTSWVESLLVRHYLFFNRYWGEFADLSDSSIKCKQLFWSPAYNSCTNICHIRRIKFKDQNFDDIKYYFFIVHYL